MNTSIVASVEHIKRDKAHVLPLVLARKFRPKTFGEMIGQEHVVQALVNALMSGRLHHAWLFTGTRGVGKTTVARILAKSLNCQGEDGTGGITAEPCGKCGACCDIDSGRFLDYTELDAASNRGVEDIQALLEQSAYKPVQGRFRVFMIDEVHMLSNTAFNAMLKTLEEPPEYLKFILATTDPQKIPITVLSRCLQLNLRPMSVSVVGSHLAHVLKQENISFEDGALRLLSYAAHGSMRDALSLTDQAIASSGANLQEVAVRKMLGVADRNYVLALLNALARGHGKNVIDICNQLASEGQSSASILEEMATVLQRMAILQIVPEAKHMALNIHDSLDIDLDEKELMQVSQLMARDETQLLYSMCLHGRAELGLAPDEQSGLIMVLLRFLAFKSNDSIGDNETLEVSNISDAQDEEQLKTKHKDKSHEELAEIANKTPTQMQAPENDQASMLNLGDFWGEVVQKLLDRNLLHALTRELALQSQLKSRIVSQNSEEVWQLLVKSELLCQVNLYEELRRALLQIGYAVQLDVQLSALRDEVLDSPSRRKNATMLNRQQKAQNIVLNNSFVKTMKHNFEAKIFTDNIVFLSDN